jgi:hypothetical protein
LIFDINFSNDVGERHGLGVNFNRKSAERDTSEHYELPF